MGNYLANIWETITTIKRKHNAVRKHNAYIYIYIYIYIYEHINKIETVKTSIVFVFIC